MTTTKISVPDFSFSSIYYADILRRLRIFNRVNAPEITAETAEEPFIQLERAFALVGHLCNVLLDLAANEVLLPTCKLQESARKLLALIDYQLRDYAPAEVELLIELTQVLTASRRILDAYALFETRREEDEDAIPFEVLEAVDVGPTNQVDAVFGLQLDRDGSDGATVVGDPDAFESASMSVTTADVGRLIEVTDSILGNTGVFEIAEVLQTGATSQIRLAGTLGGDDPLFVYETGLTWKIKAWTSNGATAVNTAGSPYFTPWNSRAVGDQLYVGSQYVMWDEFALTFQTAGANQTGVWEYYDPDLSDETPDYVENQGSYLRIRVDALLDPDLVGLDRNGTLVKVTYLPTGISEVLVSDWNGSWNYVRTSAFLGQSGTPSEDPEDYSVGTDWQPFEGISDGTAGLTQDGAVDDYTLPQTLRTNWQKVTVQDIEGYFVRFRVVDTSGSGDPVVDTISIDENKQYVLVDAVQGKTVLNEPTESSNGQEGQEFELTTYPGLRDSVEVYVDEGGGEVKWTNLTASGKKLLTSGSKDRHFVVDQDDLGNLTVRFGDGTYGKIPPLGTDNVRFVYRVLATDEGNVGASTITVNSGGSAHVKTVTNPQAAFGWREADGASEESLALVKEEGPASLRTGNRAVNPSDYEDLALQFQTASGTRPIVRAKAIEEGFGPKTVKLVVVGTNGVAISASVKEELETYFNGNESEDVEGVGQCNTEVTVVNFSPRLVALTVSIEANSALTEALVQTRLATFLNPTATTSDGTTYVWRFGGRTPISRIVAEIFQISPGNVFDVDVSTPSEDLELLEDELPLLDSSNLNVSIVAPTY